MPRFDPFPGIRYRSANGSLDTVLAPPYDVISPDEQVALEARSEHNAVRLDSRREQPGLDRYHAAAALFEAWLEEGVLVRDERPTLSLYRMDYTDEAGRPAHTLGVIGALTLEEPGTGDILPHEHTTPKPKSDRLDLLRATRANLSPVWGLSPAAGLSAACQPVGEPSAQATDDEGVLHRVWPVEDPATVDAIARLVASAPVIIADGHHRFETALAYRAERRTTGTTAHGDANGDGDGDGGLAADAVMALIVELSDDQLSVRAIHRLIAGLPAGFDLVSALSANFVVSPTAPVDATIGDRMVAAGALALVTDEGAWLLAPTAATVDAATHDLDSSRLDVALAGLPHHELSFQHGWDLAAAAVSKGEADAAVLLRPATVEQIAETGRARLRMPPKTTFFWPKPRTGVVFREVRS